MDFYGFDTQLGIPGGRLGLFAADGAEAPSAPNTYGVLPYYWNDLGPEIQGQINAAKSPDDAKKMAAKVELQITQSGGAKGLVFAPSEEGAAYATWLNESITPLRPWIQANLKLSAANVEELAEEIVKTDPASDQYLSPRRRGWEHDFPGLQDPHFRDYLYNALSLLGNGQKLRLEVAEGYRLAKGINRDGNGKIAAAELNARDFKGKPRLKKDKEKKIDEQKRVLAVLVLAKKLYPEYEKRQKALGEALKKDKKEKKDKTNPDAVEDKGKKDEPWTVQDLFVKGFKKIVETVPNPSELAVSGLMSLPLVATIRKQRWCWKWLKNGAKKAGFFGDIKHVAWDLLVKGGKGGWTTRLGAAGLILGIGTLLYGSTSLTDELMEGTGVKKHLGDKIEMLVEPMLGGLAAQMFIKYVGRVPGGRKAAVRLLTHPYTWAAVAGIGLGAGVYFGTRHFFGHDMAEDKWVGGLSDWVPQPTSLRDKYVKGIKGEGDEFKLQGEFFDADGNRVTTIRGIQEAGFYQRMAILKKLRGTGGDREYSRLLHEWRSKDNGRKMKTLKDEIIPLADPLRGQLDKEIKKAEEALVAAAPSPSRRRTAGGSGAGEVAVGGGGGTGASGIDLSGWTPAPTGGKRGKP